jgi:hypothetical protein
MSAILEKFLWQFFWHILGICTTELLFEDLKKVDFRVGTTSVENSRFFLKNDVIFEKSDILNFWFFLQKLDSEKTLRTQSRFLKPVEN